MWRVVQGLSRRRSPSPAPAFKSPVCPLALTIRPCPVRGEPRHWDQCERISRPVTTTPAVSTPPTTPTTLAATLKRYESSFWVFWRVFEFSKDKKKIYDVRNLGLNLLFPSQICYWAKLSYFYLKLAVDGLMSNDRLKFLFSLNVHFKLSDI